MTDTAVPPDTKGGWQQRLRRLRKPGPLVVLAVLVISLLTPLALDEGQQTVFVLLALAVVVTVGLSLLMGFAGQVSLGQAAFYALGAYIAGLLAKHGLAPILALAAAPAGAALVALLIGIPVLRLRGHALAFATLAFQLIVLTVIAEAKPITGGDVGLGGIPQLLPDAIATPFAYAYVAWLAAAAVILLTHNLVRSRPGRGLRALATSEQGAASSGVAVATDKLKVFTISAAYAGLAGGVYAFFLSYLSPTSFSILLSVQFLVMAAVGGLGTVWGAVVGATVITVLLQALQALAGQPGLPKTLPAVLSYAVYGVALLLVMLLLPEGLLPAIQRRLPGGRGPR